MLWEGCVNHDFDFKSCKHTLDWTSEEVSLHILDSNLVVGRGEGARAIGGGQRYFYGHVRRRDLVCSLKLSFC